MLSLSGRLLWVRYNEHCDNKVNSEDDDNYDSNDINDDGNEDDKDIIVWRQAHSGGPH